MPEMLWDKGLPLDEQLHAFTVGDDPLIDLQLLPFDAEGSAAHARMLGGCGLLPENEAKALVAALRHLKGQTERGELTITREQEDGHTALEVALTKELGPTGRRIHLARSRNDQVQTALRLWMRARLLDLGEALGTARPFSSISRGLIRPRCFRVTPTCGVPCRRAGDCGVWPSRKDYSRNSNNFPRFGRGSIGAHSGRQPASVFQ